MLCSAGIKLLFQRKQPQTSSETWWGATATPSVTPNVNSTELPSLGLLDFQSAGIQDQLVLSWIWGENPYNCWHKQTDHQPGCCCQSPLFGYVARHKHYCYCVLVDMTNSSLPTPNLHCWDCWWGIWTWEMLLFTQMHELEKQSHGTSQIFEQPTHFRYPVY